MEYLKLPDTISNWKSIKTPIIHSQEWLKDTPYQIKSIGIRDCCTSVSNAKRKYLKTKQIQNVRFRSVKSPKQSCYIPKSAINVKGIYASLVGRLKMRESLPPNRKDSVLVYEKNRWFLVVPYEEEIKSNDNQGRLIALDPGVRTFVSFFSNDSCGFIGKNAFTSISRLCLSADKLISKMKLAINSRKRGRYKKALSSIKNRINDLKNELHWKTSNWLCKNYDIILLPTFEVSEMISKINRKIGSKTVRNMLNLSHYQFKTRIKQKAKETGKTVIDVNEAYTSKTCSWNGFIKYNLGSSKTISNNGITMDRDLNGARGIYLRALVDSPCLQVKL